VSVRVEASPALAFQVFTDDVDLWWKRGIAYRVAGNKPSTVRFEGQLGGRLVEVLASGGRVHEVGRVLVWNPGQHLAFEFRGPNFQPDQVTRVDVRFEEQPDGATRVTVEHSGWDSLPADHPVRHRLPPAQFYGMWGSLWHDQLASARLCVRLRAEQDLPKH